MGTAWGFGGASRDRTGDLYNAIVALSQLSYGPTLEARKNKVEGTPPSSFFARIHAVADAGRAPAFDAVPNQHGASRVCRSGL
jgi:hypothetical protein